MKRETALIEEPDAPAFTLVRFLAPRYPPPSLLMLSRYCGSLSVTPGGTGAWGPIIAGDWYRTQLGDFSTIAQEQKYCKVIVTTRNSG